MAAVRPVRATEMAPHRVLREILRHYLEFRDLIAHGDDHVLEHSYLVTDEDETVRKVTIAFSFWDLHRGIQQLAPRKKEALFLNVILDQKQKDVAKQMGITTVSVGQYVEASTKQLVKHHFYEVTDERE